MFDDPELTKLEEPDEELPTLKLDETGTEVEPELTLMTGAAALLTL